MFSSRHGTMDEFIPDDASEISLGFTEVGSTGSTPSTEMFLQLQRQMQALAAENAHLGAPRGHAAYLPAISNPPGLFACAV